MPVFRPIYNVLPTPLPIWLMTAVWSTARNIDCLIDLLYIVFRPVQVYFPQTLIQRRRFPPLYGCSIAVTAYKLTIHRRNHCRWVAVNLRHMSCCKFWIYWVGVNTKFTTWHMCLALRPSSREGSWSFYIYICFDKGPRVTRSYPMDRPLVVFFYAKPMMLGHIPNRFPTGNAVFK